VVIGNDGSLDNAQILSDYIAAINTPSAVVTICNINPDKSTCERLFQLCGAFGDVLKIKIAADKKSAIVQMRTPQQANFLVELLNGTIVWGGALLVATAPFKEVPMSLDDEEKGLLSRDFTSDERHRFADDTKNLKHICAPSKVLHVSNLPIDATEEQLSELLGASDVIEKIEYFEKFRSMAFVTCKTVSDAVELLVEKHRAVLQEREIRISFSKPRKKKAPKAKKDKQTKTVTPKSKTVAKVKTPRAPTIVPRATPAVVKPTSPVNSRPSTPTGSSTQTSFRLNQRNNQATFSILLTHKSGPGPVVLYLGPAGDPCHENRKFIARAECSSTSDLAEVSRYVASTIGKAFQAIKHSSPGHSTAITLPRMMPTWSSFVGSAVFWLTYIQDMILSGVFPPETLIQARALLKEVGRLPDIKAKILANPHIQGSPDSGCMSDGYKSQSSVDSDSDSTIATRQPQVSRVGNMCILDMPDEQLLQTIKSQLPPAGSDFGELRGSRIQDDKDLQRFRTRVHSCLRANEMYPQLHAPCPKEPAQWAELSVTMQTATRNSNAKQAAAVFRLCFPKS